MYTCLHEGKLYVYKCWAQSMDCPAQSVDPDFVLTIYRLTCDCACMMRGKGLACYLAGAISCQGFIYWGGGAGEKLPP